MPPIATYSVGDIAERLDENNGTTLNGVAVWVSEDAETVYVYEDGYFESCLLYTSDAADE